MLPKNNLGGSTLKTESKPYDINTCCLGWNEKGDKRPKPLENLLEDLDRFFRSESITVSPGEGPQISYVLFGGDERPLYTAPTNPPRHDIKDLGFYLDEMDEYARGKCESIEIYSRDIAGNKDVKIAKLTKGKGATWMCDFLCAFVREIVNFLNTLSSCGIITLPDSNTHLNNQVYGYGYQTA